MQTFEGVLLAVPGNLFFLCLHFRFHRYLCLPVPWLQHSSGCPLAQSPSPQASPPGRSTAALGVHGCVVGMGGLFLSLSFYTLLSPTSKADQHWKANIGTIRKPCPQVRRSLPCSDEQISCSSVTLVCSYCPPLLLPCV